MNTVTLGRTGLTVNKNGFGALPIQRIPKEEAVAIVRRALDGGITFFDTARLYSDSEEKLGAALAGRRGEVILATKTPATDAAGFWRDLDASLAALQTDYIDLFQFHNPAFCPKPGDGSGLYEAMLEAREQGKIRFIGLTNHRLHVAREAVESGLYDTLQFPFCYLASPDDLALVESCRQHGVGFIAMKALSGGLIQNSAAAYAFLAQFEGVLPIWGVQRMAELEEFLAYGENPPALTEELQALIERDKLQLAGDFCRGCGYCLPCPAGIEIPNAARMSLMLRRSPPAPWLGEEWQAKMAKIDDCIHCNHCVNHCPYGLDTPKLLHQNYEDYKTFLK
ncbi:MULTISPECIES: aldo/keto reductase [Eubacteriales]|uniref:Aldo/keto reductase n=1 Tax=Bittarella massiliensis (ex Durand et al. 2017) TaxID=1720313 RepID=A0AAQ1RWF9_9FIRM|nr:MULTISPECIES: aldo/keto reductase [Eubacteriales]ERI97840.1 oxidoreductase, aldo/keto reductase family protein [Clostridium sp. ATCC 29733]MZL68301.1 aldo/keto reductase [Bittarella massiliensis (ex Durand et al. 2017)]MZL79644.1 aldo/keto reductase [Bittarella massiliensis (ex Durand et al. 2017)]SHG23141.1 Predicted oxidoreductase of the aldo/keto reductase family [Bittarella massiliensis (ex Durand et al. 2017)]